MLKCNIYEFNTSLAYTYVYLPLLTFGSYYISLELLIFYCHKMLMSLVFLGGVNDTEMQEHYDEFFEEVFTELEEKVCTASAVHQTK